MEKLGVKAYSIRNFPSTFRERAKKLAEAETEANRAVGKGHCTVESLLLSIIGEGLTRRENELKKKR